MKMNLVSTVLLGVLLVASAPAQICPSAVFDLTVAEQGELKTKADMGDQDAAYRIWKYHSFWTGNKREADKWIESAAKLGHPEAQRILANLITTYGHAHEAFGRTPQDAVLNLLTEAGRTSGQAALELAEAYMDGYFGAENKEINARKAFQIAADHQNSYSWKPLAQMLHNGQGGDPDQRKAYYLICLATSCIHPDSISGNELWELRHSIEQELSLSEIEETWTKVDSYTTRERKYEGSDIYPPPLLGTAIPKDKWNDHVKRTDEFEMQQRDELITTRGEQGVPGFRRQSAPRPAP